MVHQNPGMPGAPRIDKEGFLWSPQWAGSPADTLILASRSLRQCVSVLPSAWFVVPHYRGPRMTQRLLDPQCRALEGSKALGRG